MLKNKLFQNKGAGKKLHKTSFVFKKKKEKKNIFYPAGTNLEEQRVTKVIIPISVLTEPLTRRKTPFQKGTTLA